jgi:hypothetical protein
MRSLPVYMLRLSADDYYCYCFCCYCYCCGDADDDDKDDAVETDLSRLLGEQKRVGQA